MEINSWTSSRWFLVVYMGVYCKRDTPMALLGKLGCCRNFPGGRTRVGLPIWATRPIQFEERGTCSCAKACKVFFVHNAASKSQNASRESVAKGSCPSNVLNTARTRTHLDMQWVCSYINSPRKRVAQRKGEASKYLKVFQQMVCAHLQLTKRRFEEKSGSTER